MQVPYYPLRSRTQDPDTNPNLGAWLDNVWRRIGADSKVVAKTAAYTVNSEDHWIRVDTSGGAVTITIPLAIDNPHRKIGVIKTTSDANAVTIARTSTDTFNGATSLTLSGQYSGAFLVSNGITAWDNSQSAAFMLFLQAGTGAVWRSAQDKMREIFSVKDFGAVGDGVTDDTAAIVLAAAALSSGQTLYFPNGTYLISYQGAAYASVHGYVVMDFLSKTDISFLGERATIKVVNHDITTYGGLRFANFRSCQGVRIKGFDFDMSYTGFNNSGSFYPHCGALTFEDSSAAGQTQAQLNGDVRIEDCTFLLYHPYGAYVQTGNPYLGDPNNGYKIIPIFASGPYLATAYDEQCRNIIVKDCVIKDGHNTYGFWFWAWNDIVVEGNTTEKAIGHSSNTSGVIIGGGFVFVRYHQWHCTGISILNNFFKARPCSERTTDPYRGPASFCTLSTNLTGNYTHGNAVVKGNTIILGNGDATATSGPYVDLGVQVQCYGACLIEGNSFDGSAETTNATNSNKQIHYAVGELAAQDGKATLDIVGNTFGANSSYSSNIVFDNNSVTSDAMRRCKQLVVSDNTSLSQGLGFLIMIGPTGSYRGCAQSVVVGNVIDGTDNVLYPPANSLSVGVYVGGSAASDQLTFCANMIKGKYDAFKMNAVGDLSTSAVVVMAHNQFSGLINVKYNGFSPSGSDHGIARTMLLMGG